MSFTTTTPSVDLLAKQRRFHAAAARLGLSYPSGSAATDRITRRLADLQLRQQQSAAASHGLLTYAAELRTAATQAQNADERAAQLNLARAAITLADTFAACAAAIIVRPAPNSNGLRLRHPRWCRHRLCPLCARYRARAHHQSLLGAVEAIRARQPDARFVFVTLTKPLTPLDDLRPSLKRLNANVRKLLRWPEVKRITRGAFIGTEVSFNKTERKAHDHLHLLLHVPVDYRPGHPDWLSQPRWRALWSAVYQSPQLLSVHIKFARATTRRDLAKSLNELTKYLVKPSALYTEDDAAVHGWRVDAPALLAIARATKGLRFAAFQGTLRAARHDPGAPNDDHEPALDLEPELEG